ncbi:post-GPI attachment to proteins factor 2-like [Liolophura sinensis]|uniref:post-GPI attachment to proteins factor 2-like n=1 Tax=Liolophura sinensis TaxID=3198878 RepID=UPI003158AB31
MCQRLDSTAAVTMGKTKNESFDEIVLRIPFVRMAVVTVSLPLFSLLYCLITSVIFKPDEVNETMCSVDNFIPSVSAVTGVQPQCYVWRICIALHCTPRFAVAVMYYNMYKTNIHYISEKNQPLYLKLMRLNFWLNLVENSCLVAVTYISNRDNYPVHEKIFVVFMVTSLCYMLLNTILFKWSRPGQMTDIEQRSYWWKKVLFIAIMMSTVGLLIFFYQHRVLCLPRAFSWFSLCEYGIAFTNMGYHVTAAFEFKDKSIVAGCGHMGHTTNGKLVNNDHKKRA